MDSLARIAQQISSRESQMLSVARHVPPSSEGDVEHIVEQRGQAKRDRRQELRLVSGGWRGMLDHSGYVVGKRPAIRTIWAKRSMVYSRVRPLGRRGVEGDYPQVGNMVIVGQLFSGGKVRIPST